MRTSLLLAASLIASLPLSANADRPDHHERDRDHHRDNSHWFENPPGPGNNAEVQLGPRPYFLVEDMDASPLKQRLSACTDKEMKKSDFSIGHRGAALQFPEHTQESYEAAARMGAGIVECDVTFTQDRELVCRHSQCDLHTTTNILATPLAAKCSGPFTPAVLDPSTGEAITPATARCCTSDITLAEFKTLQGKMDGFNPAATTVETYMQGTPGWRTDLYASRGTLLTHAESIELFKQLHVKMTPELKAPGVPMPYQRHRQRWRHADRPGRAGAGGWRAGRVLRLAGDDHLLRQLHAAVRNVHPRTTALPGMVLDRGEAISGVAKQSLC